jgi:hypothetical protein
VQPNNNRTNKDKDLFFTDLIPYRLQQPPNDFKKSDTLISI